ncbi:MAG: ERCC4 domain-containing protein [Nanoarchaeota archaeon]
MKLIIQKPIFDIFSKSEKKLKSLENKEKIKIIIDYREKNSLVASYLIKENFNIEFKELKIGDYIVKDTIIERKTIPDFISSMINGRLLRQLEELKQFENKLLIIEGISKQDIYSDEAGGVNANAIRGFLLSIALKHKIPLMFTKDSEDSAKFMAVLSRKKSKEIKLNAGKKTLDKKEQLQFIIESFPGIGPKKSKELLKKFSSIQNIINAPLENLEKILGKNAKNFIELIGRRY